MIRFFSTAMLAALVCGCVQVSAWADGWLGTATVPTCKCTPDKTSTKKGKDVSTSLSATYRGEIVGGTPNAAITYGFHWRLGGFPASGAYESDANTANLNAAGYWVINKDKSTTYSWHAPDP